MRRSIQTDNRLSGASCSFAESGFWMGMGLILAITVSGVAIAWALPNVPSAYPTWFNTWTTLLARKVPAIDGYSAVSAFPVATRAFLTMGWSCIPVLMWFVLRRPALVKPNAKTLASWSLGRLLLTLFLVCGASIGVPAFLIVSTNDLNAPTWSGWLLRQISRSRFCLGFSASLVFFYMSYVLSLACSYLAQLGKTKASAARLRGS
jgi:hypothetical protein